MAGADSQGEGGWLVCTLEGQPTFGGDKIRSWQGGAPKDQGVHTAAAVGAMQYETKKSQQVLSLSKFEWVDERLLFKGDN